MNRRELEHIIRAAATIADDDEIVIIGSHAGREKDADFTRAAAAAHMADPRLLLERLRDTRFDERLRPLVESRIRADYLEAP